MTDFPTVGLKVDLSGIDQGESAYAKLKSTIEGVGDAAKTTADKLQQSASTSKVASAEAARAETDRATATVRAAADETQATAAATAEQVSQRRALKQARMDAIAQEQAALKAAAIEQAVINAQNIASSLGSVSATRQLAESVKLSEQALRAEYLASAEGVKAREANRASQAAMNAELQRGISAQSNFTSAGRLTAVGLKAHEDRLVAAAMAQTNLTEAQARAALGFKAAAVETAAATKEVEKIAEGAGRAAAGIGATGIQTSLMVREMVVLGRELGRGDFTRMAGSATILAQSMGGLALLTNPVVLAFLAATAAVIGFVAAMAAGEAEASRFQGELIATGNYAGITAGKFEDMAKRIAEAQNAGIRSTKGAITELVSSGKFTSDTIELMVSNAEHFSILTGQSADAIVKDYETMKGGVVKWAVKHEEVYHDLTLAQIDYINQLEKQGKHSEAELQVQSDIADSLQNRVVPAYGALQTAIHDTVTWASKLWDAILGIGRPKTLETQITDQASKVYDLQRQMSAPDFAKFSTAAQREGILRSLSEAQEKLKTLNQQQADIDAKAAADAKKAQQEDDRIRQKYDNQAHKEPKTKRDPVADRLATLAAEAQGNLDVAQAYDVSTAAGFRAAAMAKALTDTTKAHKDALTDDLVVQKFFNAELLVAITATEKDASKSIAATTEKTKVLSDAAAMMSLYGYSVETANQHLADQKELDTITSALVNARTLPDSAARTKHVAELTLKLQEATQAQKSYNEALVLMKTQEELNANISAAEQLSLEVQLLGKTNAERNIAIAQLKELQKLRAEGVDPKSFNGQVRIAGATLAAQNQNTTDAATAAYNKQLNAQADAWASIADNISNATSRMSDFFGTFGTGIGALLSGLANEAKALEAIAVKWEVARKAGDQREMANLDRQAASIRIQAYGDTAEAAASMFGKQTAAYKVLHAAEEAFRIFQLAMQAKAVIGYFVEAAAHTTRTTVGVANDAVSTASTTAKDTAAATTGAAAGAAQMFADLGPLGFAAVAAMTAVLAGFALSVGSPGVAPGANDAADRQKTQGTGSILGDAAAKSDSIAKALDLVAKNTNTDLQYSDKMLTALRSIDSNIGTLTAALAQSLSLGQLSGSSGLGLGSSASGPGLLTRIFAPLSNLLPGLFGTTKTTTLQDQGLQFNAQTIGDIIAKGIQGAIFQQTSTETKSKFFGITTSDKFSQNTSTSGLESGIADDLTRVIASLRSGVLAAASVLGITGAQATLDAFNLDLGKISLKDLKGQDLTDAINAIFSKAADQMAADVLPIVSQFQQAGEGAFQTLTRLAKDYETIDVALSAIGKTFGDVGLASVAAREDLISLFGGLDNFTEAVTDFSNDFLTDAQKLAPIQAAVSKEMASLGLSGITTKASFVALVQGLDLTTSAGRTMYAQLLQVAPAFAKVADAMTAAVTTANDNVSKAQQALQAAHDAAVAPYQKALTDLQNQVATARQNLTTAYNSESQALNATITSMKGLSAALRTFRASLDTGPNAQPSPQDAYFGAKALFQSTSTAAIGGDKTALANLQNVEQAFLDASKTYFASSDGYFKDLADVKAATSAGADSADSQASIAQDQLDALNQMVSGIIALNDNVMSVADALAAYKGALSDQAIIQGIIDSIDAQTDPLLKINASVLTIPEAIAGLQAALALQAAAQNAVSQAAADAALAAANAALALINSPLNPANTSTPPPSAPAGPTATSIGDLVKARPDITTEYNRLLSQADWNSPWMNQHGLFQNGSVNDFAEWWYYKGGGSSEFQFLTPPPMTHPDLGFAKGGAFQAGQIVSQATNFNIAEMAEDGPEAIMPLARTASGALGVYTTGGQGMKEVVEQLQTLTDEVKQLKVVNQQGHIMANEKLDSLVDETAGVTTAIRQAAA